MQPDVLIILSYHKRVFVIIILYIEETDFLSRCCICKKICVPDTFKIDCFSVNYYHTKFNKIAEKGNCKT